MVTVLKALGNAGHPGSIKTIMRFLPGIAASTVELPPSVLSAAVQSLRLIATRDPHSVRGQRLSRNDGLTQTRGIFNTLCSGPGHHLEPVHAKDPRRRSPDAGFPHPV